MQITFHSDRPFHLQIRHQNPQLPGMIQNSRWWLWKLELSRIWTAQNHYFFCHFGLSVVIFSCSPKKNETSLLFWWWQRSLFYCYDWGWRRRRRRCRSAHSVSRRFWVWSSALNEAKNVCVLWIWFENRSESDFFIMWWEQFNSQFALKLDTLKYARFMLIFNNHVSVKKLIF